MKAFDRVIFIVLGIILIACSVGIAYLIIDSTAYDAVVKFVSEIDITDIKIIVVVFALIIIKFLAGVKLLFVSPKKDKVTTYTILKNEEGEAAVSLTAIENTVRLAMAQFDDVKESKISAHIATAGVTIYAKLAIPTGIVIPELVGRIRTTLKEFTEIHTGVNVINVRIVATEYKTVDPSAEKKRMAIERKAEEKHFADETKAQQKANEIAAKKSDAKKDDDGYAVAPARSIIQENTEKIEAVSEPAAADDKQETASEEKTETEN